MYLKAKDAWLESIVRITETLDLASRKLIPTREAGISVTG